ncbi:hypothetical protein M0811_09241 [Anaeramoeba ignava]|uniref:BTB domain-containing protein n=1 Tax=Anaeramoeba ignava TaxID=1746090 RepID=A0A9Q0LJ75_ANAIG|nr:hypothetical protein M0811_09241 [Anaeramoeba ignava]
MNLNNLNNLNKIKHHFQLINSIYSLRNSSNSFQNFTILTGKNLIKIYSHKLILSCRSSYFYQIFKQNPSLNEISFPEINETIMNLILDYIYKGEIDFNERNVFKIWNISQKFELNDLSNSIQTYLESNIQLSNVFKIFRKSKSNSKLNHQSFDFIIQNFEKLIPFISKSKLSEEQMKEIVEKSFINNQNLQIFSLLNELTNWAELIQQKILPKNPKFDKKAKIILMKKIIKPFFKILPINLLNEKEFYQLQSKIGFNQNFF